MIAPTRQIHISDNQQDPVLHSFEPNQPTLELISQLCTELVEQSIDYCHWKSNNALDRSASGENDLDLLVSRADMDRFGEILHRLGFKRARASAQKQMPGVFDYFGSDSPTGRLVHVHAHFQLVLGHDMTKNYRIPIERQYLESAVQGDLFRTPAYEYEFIVLVIRMVLKHCAWDVMLAGQGELKKSEWQELAYLQERIDVKRTEAILERDLPYIRPNVFRTCVRALKPDASARLRIQAGRQLQASLRTCARRPRIVDIYMRLWRRVQLAVRRRVHKTVPKYRPECGGVMIAIVGGDGSGKSTAVDALQTWLASHFDTMAVHMGKPRWSWTTKSVRGFLKVGNWLHLYPEETTAQRTLTQSSIVSPAYPWLVREVCRARDRYGVYYKARRFAADGGVVLLDRYPLEQVQLMDGPQAERFTDLMAENGHSPGPLNSLDRSSRFTRTMIRLEESYYDQIAPPDLLLVLYVQPEIAVQRKTDEDADAVRTRSTEIWKVDWERTQAHVIDGAQSKSAVLAELKRLIWSQL